MREGTIDRVGQVMGTMEVLSFSHHQPKSGNALWNANCLVCGYQSVVQWNNRTKSGCRSCHGRKQVRSIKYKLDREEEKDLYMIRCGPYVKIGVSSDVPVRLKSIQAGNPHICELVGLWKGEGHREESWHKALEHCHVRGEWFLLQRDG